ncbi:N-acetylmuramoyl-L-alanine amidase family protein [Chitinasiproducens palmae]|uniref:N-acetylmuramoyl-L-alanine amidase n=1 Tax=Chitinasiproducens palmae TaxID=1770053 RepID=A0A1H2PKD6_9BURK|nr:N-acetylmuramoyl-L-alanine amidase [Chitinasiproducens palmae]SDV46877.1 N-acetylmuramoyl-L-alanine amidase [Chitinasiproducens palmae]
MTTFSLHRGARWIGIACTATTLLHAAVSPASALAAGPRVALDAGHSPAQPGARSAGGAPEHRFNTTLRARVADDLRAAGASVAYTAGDDEEIALQARSSRVPDADLFVSLHHDSMQQAYIDAGRQREFHGFAIFVSARNPDYQQSLRCAKAIGARLRAAGQQPSLYHAEPIRGENRPIIDGTLGIHRFDDLVVLRTARMPALLIEAGVIANPDEEARLQQPATVARVAGAISAGVLDCSRTASRL